MRPLVYSLATTLDGYLARGDGAVDWCSTRQDYGFQAFLDQVDTIVLGRKTYEQVAKFTPYPYTGRTHYIASRSGRTYPHGQTIGPELPEFVAELKRTPGGVIWLVGGGEVAGTLLAAGLVDRIDVCVHPLLLGGGLPLAAGLPGDIELKTVEVKPFDDGLVKLVYEPQVARPREPAPTAAIPETKPAMRAANESQPVVELYTDGACRGNPGPGGWAYILKHPASGTEREGSGGEARTTNNRMELQAVVEGLATLTRPSQVTLFTDSQYVSKGLGEWLPGWKRNGWRRREGKAFKPIKNDDLWRRLDELIAQHTMKYQWVRGHAGHPENERCDELAVAAAEAQRQG